MIRRRGRGRRVIVRKITAIINIRSASRDNKKRHLHTQTDAMNPKINWGNVNNNNDDKNTDDDNDKKTQT